MIDVWKCGRERVVEHGGGLSEVDAVNLEILFSLVRILSEFHGISVRLVERIVGSTADFYNRSVVAV